MANNSDPPSTRQHQSNLFHEICIMSTSLQYCRSYWWRMFVCTRARHWPWRFVCPCTELKDCCFNVVWLYKLPGFWAKFAHLDTGQHLTTSYPSMRLASLQGSQMGGHSSLFSSVSPNRTSRQTHKNPILIGTTDSSVFLHLMFVIFWIPGVPVAPLGP